MLYGNVLKNLREEKELSQKDIAKSLKIDNSLYAKYEKEYNIIPIQHLNSICNYLNVLDLCQVFRHIFMDKLLIRI